jgi:hypothetical protein
MRVNVRAFGCRRFRFSRIWTVMGFLIPILNFYRPYQVTSEVWRASDPRAMNSPAEWKRMPLPRIVSIWWATLLAGAIFEGVAILLLTSSGESITHLAITRGISAIAGLTTTAASVVAFLLVSQLERLQQTKWAILNHETEVLDEFSPTRPSTTIPSGAATANSV